MFAVIKTGGKQYKVSAGDILKIERIVGEAGSKIDFSEVLMLNDTKTTQIGNSVLEKALVKATILEQARGDKIIVFKKKRRQGYDRKNGHRQDLTVVHIDEILDGGKSLAKAEAKPRAAKKEVKKAVKTVEKKPVKAPVAPKKKAVTVKAKTLVVAKEKPVKTKVPAQKKVVAKKEAPKKLAPQKTAPKRATTQKRPAKKG
jgi:large subunit ribosomal protein L21